MLDQKRLDAVRLQTKPLAQRVFGSLVLLPNFRNPLRPTRIVLEGKENIPAQGGSIFVMNHTDRYNCWPFQFQLWREGFGFTATWVKGKYYENPAMGWFMDVNNNIPIPSKGYVLTKDFEAKHGRVPSNAEYAEIKTYLDDKGSSALVAEGYRDEFAARFEAMMKRVVELNHEAFRLKLNLLIFPEGTRSRTLTQGQIGAAQIALHLGVPIIPVGCSGSDHCYPGNSPLSRGGRITYRVGKPLKPAGELAKFAPGEDYTPFTPSAEKHEAKFRALTDLMIERIGELVDPEYRASANTELAQGAKRFV